LIFVDASAFLSIIVKESDVLRLAAILNEETTVLCSAVLVWETITALCRSYKYAVPRARSTADSFVRDLNFHYVPIGEREAEIAAMAYERFGKGRHAAALNMGDCFAYACARANGARLLFKGDDFTKTDIARA